jgi:hypothetical protein
VDEDNDCRPRPESHKAVTTNALLQQATATASRHQGGVGVLTRIAGRRAARAGGAVAVMP